MRKTVSRIMLTLLLMGVLTLAFNIQPVKAEPKTWYVDDDGGADFTKIQDAIYAASPGDTIYVYNGTYYEHIYISKSLTLIGENKYATIIDGYGWTDAAIRIYWTNRVNLTGFTVRNAGYGISVRYSNNNRFFGNIISDVGNRGIELYPDSWNNTISGNTISDITGYPAAPGVGGRIAIWLSLYGNIVDSNIISNSECGIYLGGPPEKWSHDNIVEGNVISNNDAYGINVWGYNNRIIGNTITNMGYVGIQLNSPDGHPNQCTNNVVSGNVISQSTFGINLIMAAFSNMIERNDVLSSNGQGILLGDSDNNTVRGNLVSNAYYGILLFSSDDTKVYHNNFVDNTQQVLLSESFNTVWDDGYPSGGNYWSDYTGVDADGDGIGDAPYVIDVYNQDSYPLMAPINMFDAGTWNGTSYSVDVVSNSTISDFYFNPYEGAFLEFRVTGEAGTCGFCRVTIPKGLLWTDDGWVVLVDGEPVDYSQIEDENFTYLYFNYIHSTHEIQIVGTYVIVPPPLTYSLTITTTVGGTTDPATGTYSYTAESSVQATAIPDAGYSFDYWELDDVNVGSANPYTILMDKDHTLKAFFSSIPPPLSASISPLSASILVGQSVTFTSTVSGGYTPYSYQWYLNGAPVSGATSNTWTFTPTTSGIYYIYLKVTDAKANTTQSDTAHITVTTVPVGGYSFPLEGHTTAKPLTFYLALVAILAVSFTMLKRKTHRRKKDLH